MPWCDPCARFYNPNTLLPDGSCPACGRSLARPRDGGARAGAAGTQAPRARAPWHFWLLVAAAALYLGWRAVQGVVWLVGLL
jgi:hypothetical protein